jgi:glyoxylase-like metal-dependent hydrolase (beta-lactamase superfamily II)
MKLTALLFVSASVVALAQQPPALETLRVQHNVYAIFGAGGNVTVQIGDEGVLIVDSGVAASAPALLAEIRKLSPRPIRFLINTHMHPDHVGGNVALSRAPAEPRPDFQPLAGAAAAADPLQPLNIIAHENVLRRMTATVTVRRRLSRPSSQECSVIEPSRGA